VSTQDDINQLIGQARVKLVGVTEAALKLELFDVLKEFFDYSSVWSEDVSIIIAGDGVTREYSVVPNGGTIIRLAGVVDANGFVQPAIMPTPGTILFATAFTVAQTFTATVIKNVDSPLPKSGFVDVPEFVLKLHGIGILDGLLGRKMMETAKPYTDQKRGEYYLRRFITETSKARTAALRRNTFGTQAWSYPQSFQTRTQKGGTTLGNDTRFQ
jgi:hypothetical protein